MSERGVFYMVHRRGMWLHSMEVLLPGDTGSSWVQCIQKITRKNRIDFEMKIPTLDNGNAVKLNDIFMLPNGCAQFNIRFKIGLIFFIHKS